MDNPRKKRRTGAHKRQQRARMGAPRPPDESVVKSAQTATVFFTESGRYELATGFTLRVPVEDDLAACPLILEAARKHGRVLAERMLTPAMVAGIEPVAKQLEEIVSFAGAGEELDAQTSPDEIVVAAAAKFAGSRRKAIARLAKGAKNATLRHAFGINTPMARNNLTEVRNACLALLSGRSSHPGSPAARMITVADVKKAKAYVAQMGEIQIRQGARRSSTAETARLRDVLHAAVELFYDRFGAAVDVAFEDDDATRVALLSLIPRRKEQRKVAAKPPATNVLPKAANG
jgi:hypothetical protein